MVAVIFFAVVGACISAYTYWVEQRLLKDPNFKPICDINDRISCTKAMKSPYSKIFFVSNALMGVMFYVLIIAAALLHISTLLFILCLGGAAASCVLAYLLYFRIKSICLLCTTMYVINFVLLYLSLYF